MEVLVNKIVPQTLTDREHPILVVLSETEIRNLHNQCALIPDKKLSLPIKITVGDSVVEAEVPISVSVSRAGVGIDIIPEGDDCHGEALGW